MQDQFNTFEPRPSLFRRCLQYGKLLLLLLVLQVIVLAAWDFIGATPFSAMTPANRAATFQEELVGHPAELIGPKGPVRPIPDGLGNYRGKSLTATQFEQLLQTGQVGVVIRMNGDGKDAGKLTTKAERALCERYGVRYVVTSAKLNRFDAHAGYEEGRGYVRAAREAARLLARGGVFIHCRHGTHRTGAIVGYHLKQLGWSREDIIRHNRWENLNVARYRRYLETLGA